MIGADPPGRHRRGTALGKHRADVEGMRGLAVLLVVAYHAGIGVISGGYVGVDVFFVLSGFLITGLLVDELRRTGTVSLRDFYARRVRRLLPHSTLVLAVTAVATTFVISPLERGGIASDIRAAALFFANWHFAAGSTQYMADTDKSPVLHFWSLSVEEQFYVVWPLLLLLVVGRGLAKRDWSRTMRRLAIALAALGIGSFVVSWLFTAASGPFGYFGVHTRAWELAAGGGLALARPALSRLPRALAALAGWGGLLLVLASATMMDEATVFPGTAAAVPVAGTVLLVLGGHRVRDAGVARLLSTAPMTYLGRISYGWYLWHWPVLTLVRAHYDVQTDPTLGTTSGGPGPVVIAAAVLLSFLLAAVFNHVLETPVRQSRWLAAVRGRSLRLGVLLSVTSVAVAATLQPTNQDSESAASELASAAASLPQLEPAAELPSEPSTPTPSASASSAPPGRVYPRRATTPKAAQDDSPLIKVGECGGSFATTKAPKPCVLGDPNGTVKIGLIGDSHAAAWMPAFDLAARTRGWKVHFLSKSACTVTDLRVWRKGVGADKTCPTWRDDVFRRLAEGEHLDAVFVARFAAWQSLVLGSNGRPLDPSRVHGAWAAGTQRLLDKLRPVTDRVVILRDIPWPGQDVPACLSESPKHPERCAFNRSDGIVDGRLFQAERSVAARNPQLGFVDLTTTVCPRERCQVVTSDGLIKFRDTHHLTASFSATLATAIAPKITAALAEPAARAGSVM